MPRGRRCHVRQHHIGQASERRSDTGRGVRLGQIEDENFNARQRLDLVEVGSDHRATPLAWLDPLRRNLAPAAGRGPEIDDKYRLLMPGMRVVDLGAAPGGWSQVAAERVTPSEGSGTVIAADLNEIEPLPGVEILTLDLTEADAASRITAALGGLADVVLSDMAAPATGHRATDHLRVVALAEAALDVAEGVLAPGGTFLAKVFQGGAGQDLVARLKQGFAKVRHVKPKASRAESPEVYVLATGFRGGNPA